MTVNVDAAKAEAAIYQRRLFSQFGEDAVLAWIFPDKRNGFYVDVGCHHPFRISNTALLHLERDWTGLNIDVDERAIAAFERFRPGDINVCSGVAGQAGMMEVTLFDEGAINTFNEASAANPAWAAIGRTKKLVHVDTLSALLRTHLPASISVDLLNIDAEGLDYEILSSNDWSSFRPEIVMVETDSVDLGSLAQNKTFCLLRDKGYYLMSHVAITSFYRRA